MTLTFVTFFLCTTISVAIYFFLDGSVRKIIKKYFHDNLLKLRSKDEFNVNITKNNSERSPSKFTQMHSRYQLFNKYLDDLLYESKYSIAFVLFLSYIITASMLYSYNNSEYRDQDSTSIYLITVLIIAFISKVESNVSIINGKILSKYGVYKKLKDGDINRHKIRSNILFLLVLLFGIISPLYGYIIGTPSTKVPGTEYGHSIFGELNFHNISEKIYTLDVFFRIMILSYPIFLFTSQIFEIKTVISRLSYESEGFGLNILLRFRRQFSLVLSVIFSLWTLGVDLSNLGVISGILVAGLSVAMRESIGNFISGLQLTWDGSIKINDVITLPNSSSDDTGSTYGIVKDIRPRYTVIEDRNAVRRLVPNYLLASDTIEHWTHEDSSVRLSLLIGVPYFKDANEIRQMQKIMESVCFDVPRVLTTRTPNALLVRYGESSLDFSLRFWIEDAHNGIRPVISEVLVSLYERILDADFNIPYPQRDLHIRSLPETSSIPEIKSVTVSGSNEKIGNEDNAQRKFSPEIKSVTIVGPNGRETDA